MDRQQLPAVQVLRIAVRGRIPEREIVIGMHFKFLFLGQHGVHAAIEGEVMHRDAIVQPDVTGAVLQGEDAAVLIEFEVRDFRELPGMGVQLHAVLHLPIVPIEV